MPTDLYATLQQTVNDTVAAYSSPKPWNPDQIWATRSDDCLHYIHPTQGLSEEFRGAIDKNHHVQALNILRPVFERFDLKIAEAVIDVSTKTVVIRLTAKYDLIAVGDEEEMPGLETEFMWLLEMDQSGSRIRRVEEFLDPSSFLDLVTGRAVKYAESQKLTAR